MEKIAHQSKALSHADLQLLLLRQLPPGGRVGPSVSLPTARFQRGESATAAVLIGADGPVLLPGDVAHVITPNLGQGAG